ncbi:MAG: hypothetical protein JXQ72_02700, partial [Anaerolineae bacterium]|nr:hypothetical protein [Anaerolineae bacterium]
MSTGPVKRQYGQSTDLFVSRKESDQTLVLGGVGQEEQRWVHIITQRAAQVLWFKLTNLLFPEKSDVVTGLAATAPLRAPDNNSITTHVEVVENEEAQYTLVGWVQRNTWMVQLSELETRRLWAALDLALYPVGWEGRESK